MDSQIIAALIGVSVIIISQIFFMVKWQAKMEVHMKRLYERDDRIYKDNQEIVKELKELNTRVSHIEGAAGVGHN